MTDLPQILLTGRDKRIEARLAQSFDLHFLTDYADRNDCFDRIGGQLRAIFYNGAAGRFTADVYGRLPALEMIAVVSSGYDHIDAVAARRYNVIVTNAGGANAVDVAEFAVGLLLDAGRNILGGDQHVREGRWGQRPMGLTRRISGRSMGLIGLGHIGLEIAKRCAAFDMAISYHNRRERADVPYKYFADPLAMAAAVDILIIAAPGGKETHHLVNAEMLDALGTDGIVVNIGRGTIIDQVALIEALRDGRIAAAGLDVLENEPEVPPALAALKNVVLTPHQASLTKDALRAAIDNAAANLEAHFAGQPALTPVN